MLLRRIGALAAVGLIAATAALVVRGTGSNDRISTADAAAAVAAVAIGGAGTPQPLVIEPAIAAPTVSAPATPERATTEAAISAASSAEAPANVEIAGAGRAVSVAAVVDTKRTCVISYTVRAGDYWISIAKRSTVKLADLLTANGANVTTPIYPGRTICLPANATPPTTAKPTPTTAQPTSTSTKPTPTTAKPTPTTTKPKLTANTTPPTIAAPATTAPPPHNNYSRAEVEQIIRNVWPDDLEDEAVRIAKRESNLIPTVRNSCCYGLFQIYFTANKASLVSWGITSATALYDPQTNAYAAFAMYLRAGGWGPWAL